MNNNPTAGQVRLFITKAKFLILGKESGRYAMWIIRIEGESNFYYMSPDVLLKCEIYLE